MDIWCWYVEEIEPRKGYRSTMLALVLALLGPTGPLQAQPQHAHWFFGFGAGLDLSTPVPTPTPGPLSTDEGCASISDPNGQLLFFTNGETVWDRNLAQMPNGWGLLGHYSSSQSALIVPMPDNTDRYYIFTAPSEAGFWNGQPNATYSTVDMTQNGGLGDVITKNVVLTGPVTEKLTAVRHRNGRDVWVVYHGWNTDQYLAYLVTCTGVEGPVVSSVGYTPTSDAQGSGMAAIGCMKLDRQGDHLAAVWTDPVVSTPQVFQSWVFVDVLDFDDQNGTLSALRRDTIGDGSEIMQGYGVEWSPNGRFLYVSDAGLMGGMAVSNVYQYDLQAPDPMVTGTVVGYGNPAHGSMQVAPDGSILIARLNGATYLGAITAPDLPGLACGYVSAAVPLGNTPSTWGLPNQWDTYPDPGPFDPLALSDTLLCEITAGLTLSVELEHPFHVPTYLWSTGATGSSITVSTSGTYWVEVQLPCSTITDTVHVILGGIPVDLGEDRTVCDDDPVQLHVPDGAISVLWNTGDTTGGIVAEQSGLYSVEVTDAYGCITSDQVLLEFQDCSCPLYVPNAFTPNGDGINDTVRPSFPCPIATLYWSVFDRWGQELFSSSNGLAWDGTVNGQPIPAGVYVWQAGVLGHTDHRALYRGHITLVR